MYIHVAIAIAISPVIRVRLFASGKVDVEVSSHTFGVLPSTLLSLL